MKRSWTAAAIAALICGCGGGDRQPAESETSTRMGTQISELRSRLSAGRQAAPGNTSPEQAIDQLFDFAQQSYATLFPGHPPSVSSAPYRFRYYPETGIYLGVVISDGPTLKVNGVYAMGGAFGNTPQYLGQLTDFILPTKPDPDPDPTPKGLSSNGCFDLSAAEAIGSHQVVTYQLSGYSTGTSTVEFTTIGPAVFEGHDVIESLTKTTGTITTQGQTVTRESENRSFDQSSVIGGVTHFGTRSINSMPIGGFVSSTVTTNVYTPAYVEPVSTLALGASATVTISMQVNSTTTYSLPNVPPKTFSQLMPPWTTTYRFAARESVTVPAGTFAACKFVYTTQTDLGLSEMSFWFIDGVGVMVKMAGGPPGMTGVQEAVSITRNGQVLSN